MNTTCFSFKLSYRVLAGVLLLAGGLLVAADPQENIIAPFPAKALKATSVVKGNLSCSGELVANDYSVNDGRVNYTLTLKPSQSVMVMLRAKNVGWMKLYFTDKSHKWPNARGGMQVGGKLFMINRRHEDMTIVAVVSGRNAMSEEPYELIICEIDTELALQKTPTATEKQAAAEDKPAPEAKTIQ
jgi:hypothetical protein